MELTETIELMQSEDFKERFKAEYWQAKIRHDKLAKMLKKYRAGTLDFEPKCTETLLDYQLSVMKKYLFVLEDRARIEEIELHGGHE